MKISARYSNIFSENSIVTLALLFLAAYLYRGHFADFVYVDDAFIYLRYVRNILAGEGWVYNLGEYVNACSSAIYPIILSIFGWIGQGLFSHFHDDPLVLVPAIVQLISSWLMAVLVFRVFRSDGLAVSLGTALVVAFHPILLKSAGMESCLLMLVVVATLFAAERERWFIVGLLLAVAGLTRTEGYALLPVVAFCYGIKLWPFRNMLLLGFLLPTVAWGAFSYFYFNSLVPNSTFMKVLQAGSDVKRGSYLDFFARYTDYLVWILLLAFFGFVDFILDLKKRSSFMVALLMFCGIQFSVYAFTGSRGGYFWYYTPSYIGLSLLMYRGCIFILRPLLFKMRGASPVLSYCRVTLCLLVVVLVNQFGILPYTEISEYRHARKYYNLSKWIDATMSEQARVSALEIGYIGYYSNRYIVDPLGLIHLEAQTALPKGERDFWYKLSPSIIVIMKNFTKDPYKDADKIFSRDNAEHFRNNFSSAKQFGNLDVWVMDKAYK